MTALSPTTITATLTAAAPKASRRFKKLALIAATVAAIALPGGYYAKKKHLASKVMHKLGLTASVAAPQPFITGSRPADSEGSVQLDAFIAADISLVDGNPIDAATVNANSVRLVTRDGAQIPAKVNTSAAGDAVVLQPEQPLEPNTYYRFQILPLLKDTTGKPFKKYSVGFTTSGAGNATKLPVAFEQVGLPQTAGHMYTCVTVGPDGKLYGATYDGSIFRYDLNADGTIAGSTEIKTLKSTYKGPRLISSICFDPKSTSEAPIAYVGHGQCCRETASDWTGKISKLSGPNLSQCQELITGLPRAARDHLNNQISFGPDGALYFAQGSNSAMGRADGPWGMRSEHLLNAAVLRVDLAKLPTDKVLDVKTEDGGTYNPYAANAPMTIYATGIRNAYDLLWHSNGHLYAPINGSGAGGNTPAGPNAPALSNVRYTVPDQLADVRPGSFHGHPNPTRGQFVLMGGNPTGKDVPVRVDAYPVGTQPEKHWTLPAAEFGRNLSPNGIIEYHGQGANSMLNGAMFVTRYSGGKDVVVLIPNADGTIKEMLTGIDGLTRMNDPLDLTQHPATGNLYVAEFGGKKITLVKVKAGVESAKVYRTPVTPAQDVAIAK